MGDEGEEDGGVDGVEQVDDVHHGDVADAEAEVPLQTPVESGGKVHQCIIHNRNEIVISACYIDTK